MLKLAVVLGGVVATCVLSAGIAAADNDTEGGHCEYGDASINLNPSCDTAGGGSGPDPDLRDNEADLSQVLGRLPGFIGGLEQGVG